MIRRGIETDDVFQADDLKICDLCGSLNLAANQTCFSCDWHGHFDTRPQVVRLAMEMVRSRDGAIRLEQVTDTKIAPRPSQSIFAKLRRSFRQARLWLFG